MHEKSNLKKNYIYNLSYQVLLVIVPLITTPYISRKLGSENIGIYSYASSLVTYFSLISLLGMHNYAIREIAYCNNRKECSDVFNEVQTTKLFSCIITLIIYVVFVFSYSRYTSLLFILSITIIANYFDISWFYQGQENFKIIVIRNIVVKVISVLSIFIFVKNSEDLYIYAIINVLSVLFGNISLWLSLKKSFVKIRLIVPSQKTIRISLEMFLPLIAVQIYNVLDKTMLGLIRTNMNESGCYEQTTKIISLSLTLITSLTTVLAPKMAASFARKDYKYIEDVAQKTFQIAIMLSMPLCFGIIAISDCFVPWFFGNGYDLVKILLKIYSLVLLVIPFSNVAGVVILTPIGEHNKGTIAVVIGAGLNFALNLILIPKIGAIGAAIATIVAECLVSYLHIYFAKKYININITLIMKNIIKYGVISVVMGAIVFELSKLLLYYIDNLLIISLIQIISGMLIYVFFVAVIIREPLVLDFINAIKNKIQKKR